MSQINFHQIAHDLLNKEVEVITLNGTFNGRLHETGTDVIILHTRRRTGSLRLAIRIETIVAIFRVEAAPRGPFGFMAGEEFEQDQNESR